MTLLANLRDDERPKVGSDFAPHKMPSAITGAVCRARHWRPRASLRFRRRPRCVRRLRKTCIAAGDAAPACRG